MLAASLVLVLISLSSGKGSVLVNDAETEAGYEQRCPSTRAKASGLGRRVLHPRELRSGVLLY